MQKKRQIQLLVRDRMNSICPMNFFRTTDTTDATDTTIWKPGFTHVKPVKVYVRTHVKITRQWRSTFRPVNILKSKKICFYKNPRIQNPCHSLFSGGIICGPHRGSLAVRDHLRSNLGIISRLGIICGRGSFAALYSFALFGPFSPFCFSRRFSL